MRCLRVRDLRLESRNSPVCTVRRPGRERGAGGGALAGLSGVDLARMRRMPSSAAAAEAGARGGRADGGGWRLRLIAMRESGRRAASSEVAAAGQRRAAQDGAWMSGSRAALQAGFRLPWPPLVPFHASSVARAHRVLGGGGGDKGGGGWACPHTWGLYAGACACFARMLWARLCVCLRCAASPSHCLSLRAVQWPCRAQGRWWRRSCGGRSALPLSLSGMARAAPS